MALTEKKCTKCGIVKPLSDYDLDSNRSDGYYTYCKTCVRKYGSELRNRARLINTDERLNEIRKLTPTKLCSKCGEVKPIDDFGINRNRIKGFDGICKSCRRIKYNEQVESMTNNKIDEIVSKNVNKYCRECQQVKPIEAFPIDRSCSDGHKALCGECNKERNHKHYISTLDYRIKYRKDHKEKYSTYHKEEGERLKALVLTHYGNDSCACVMCGESRVPVLSIDHINGGGTKHRRSLKIQGGGGIRFYKWLIKENYPEGFRTLCMNCQYVVEYERRQNKNLTTT